MMVERTQLSCQCVREWTEPAHQLDPVAFVLPCLVSVHDYDASDSPLPSTDTELLWI